MCHPSLSMSAGQRLQLVANICHYWKMSATALSANTSLTTSAS